MNNGTFNWEDCANAFGAELVEALAKKRGYSREFCQWLKNEKLIGLYEGKHVAFPVSNGAGKVTGAHYRVEGNNAWYYTKGQQALPFVIGSVAPDINHVFESQWDGLAYMDASGDRSGIVITRGASNTTRLPKLLPQDSIVCLWPQNDKAGQKWAADIRQQFKGKIKVAATPAGHKDLNDWTRAGATAEDVLNAFTDAKDYEASLPEKGQPSEREIAVKGISTIKMEAVRFIDKPLFQENAFHLLVGKKNAGKGTFLTSEAARITRGELGPKCNVLWIAAGEDSYSMDVKPRLIAAGGVVADKSGERFFYPTEPIRLPADIPALKNTISRIGGVGLVVIDPIAGTLGSAANTNMDSDVRAAIAPLNDLASELKCLVVGVRHLKKESSQGALESVLGSTDWANVPRVVLAIAMDDQDQDVRHVQVIAGNRLPRGTASRSFRIVGAHVIEGGEPVAKAEFIEGNGKDVDDMLRAEQPDTKKKSAEMQILDELEKADDLGEDMKSSDLIRLVREVCSASEKTIRNATDHLKAEGLIRFVPRKDENGKVTEWRIRRSEIPRPSWLKRPHGHPAQI